MRAAVIAFGLLATPALALPEGCFERAYTAEHLAADPGQTVSRLTVGILHNADGEHLIGEAAVSAVFRDEGTRYDQYLVCWEPGPEDAGAPAGAIACGVECDGGRFYAWEKDAERILLRTQGFLVSGDCSEPGEDAPMRAVKDDGPGETTFLLNRVDPALCRPAR